MCKGTTILGAFLIGESAWILPGLVLVLIAAATLWLAYHGLRTDAQTRKVAAVLKTIALILLSVCLIEPLWSGVQAKPKSNLIVLLADNSASMQMRNSSDAPTASYAKALTDLVAIAEDDSEAQNWQRRLEQDFDVRRILFDTHVRAVDTLKQLTFDGNRSSLGAALDHIRTRYEGQPLGGVLLFTDGIPTDVPDATPNTKGLPPIYPVRLGDGTGGKDLAIESLAVSETAFEDAPVTIQTHVTAHGFPNETILAQLLAADGKVIQRLSDSAGDTLLPLTFRFQLRPDKLGVAFYQVQVIAESEIATTSQGGEDQAFSFPPQSVEATLANNARLVAIERRPVPHRILYVSGRPNWEFKFLRRAVDADEQMDLVGLIRVAKREVKFDFRGHVGESSNPLFRGFQAETDAETERYDEPVLVRLNTKTASELRDGFPKKEEDLYGFDAVILDDLEAAFFTHDQMALLQRFVSDRGGSLLMLGGMESLREGDYRHTPIAEMLPVYLDKLEAAPPHSAYRLALTRSGWLTPWVRLRDNEQDEHDRLDHMPAFHVLNRIHGIKPGATVLANAADESNNSYPALVSQRFGRGRCVVLTLGDLWRWQLQKEEESDDLPKAWRQIVRWLVANVAEKLEMQADAESSDLMTAVRFQVRVRDDAFQPRDNTSVRVSVKRAAIDHDYQDSGEPAAGAHYEFDAEPSLREAGVFESTFVPQQAGAYLATATVFDEKGDEIASREIGWTSEPQIKEFQTTVPNEALMTQLADATGGKLIAANDLETFVERLPRRPMPMTEQWTASLWDHPFVFLIVIGCLIGEWGIRRRKGLP